ncbi:MAG: 16S rRNA (cytosine(967)-C(5))-methyltransferase RsmB [Pyrinomonadaceae bacterium]
MKISPARLAAFEILSKIEKERAFSSVLLPQYENDLSLQDCGLCHALTLGILRKQIGLDRLIDQYTKGKKIDSAVRIALRIGLYQLLFLDKVPDYSAINESVNLVQYGKKTSAKGFVNAILRRATREKIDIVFTDHIDRISVETSHPRWLIEKWIGQFGENETTTLAAANNDIPQIAFRTTARSAGAPPGNVLPSEYVEGCFIADNIDEELLAMAERGEIYFQDEASQMVAASVDLKEGEKFLDVCAAPGSKATLIANKFQISNFKFQISDLKAQTANSGLIVAGDLHYQRVQFMRSNFEKQGIDNFNLLQYDAVKSLPFGDESFDVVLVDAPCSGTGTIRHNPEIRYFLSVDDFNDLSRKQLVILQNASKFVKTGGRLIYSTCSLEQEENEIVCADFLAANPDFDKIRPEVPDKFINDELFVHTSPHRDNMDGFFIAAFERVSAKL